MSPADPELLRVADALGLPQPERARFLEEVAGDLEELRRELVDRGMEPQAAHAEALRLLAPSETAVSALASVHEPLYASLARRFSSGMRLAEWVGLAGLTVAVLLWAVGSLAATGLLYTPPFFLAPVLAVAVSIMALAGRKAIELYLVRDHAPDRLHSGLVPLLVGSGLAVALAFLGAVIDAIGIAGRLEVAPQRSAELIVPWLLHTATLLSAGLVTALIGSLAWFLLSHKAAAVARAEMRASRALQRALEAPAVRFQPSIPPTGA